MTHIEALSKKKQETAALLSGFEEILRLFFGAERNPSHLILVVSQETVSVVLSGRPIGYMLFLYIRRLKRRNIEGIAVRKPPIGTVLFRAKTEGKTDDDGKYPS